MRIAEYKQIDTRTIEQTIHHSEIVNADGTGTLQDAWDEVVLVEKPIMGMVYRDATPEEEAEALRQQAEAEEYERTRPRTTEEELADLAEYVQVFTDMLLGGAE